MTELTPVESSNVRAVGYDADARQLTVAFRGGSVYRYADVPPDVYQGLMAAPSKGRYLAKVIVHSGSYACEKLPPSPSPSPEMTGG